MDDEADLRKQHQRERNRYGQERDIAQRLDADSRRRRCRRGRQFGGDATAIRRPPAGYERLMSEAGVRPTEFSSEDVSIDTLPGLTCGHLLVYKFGPGEASHGR